MTTTTQGERPQLWRVLDHIDANLDADLTVARLGAVAGLSLHHFHRTFSRSCGLAVHDYVRLVRLEHAAWHLAFRRQRPILDIALRCGYGSHAAFTRAFRRVVGQTPTQFRQRPDWDGWHETVHVLEVARARVPRPMTSPRTVDVVDCPTLRLAAIEHHGAPERIEDTLRAFIDWRRQAGPHPRVSSTYTLVLDEPHTASPTPPRFAVAAVVGHREVPENNFGVAVRILPGGRCAVVRHVGPDRALHDAVIGLATRWLAASGESRRSAPVHLNRVRLMPDVPEHHAVTDIHLPLTASTLGQT